MSWYLTKEDYANEVKKTTGTKTQKRVKLPTQYRTKKKTKPCSICKEPSIVKIRTSNQGETRRLCYTHYADYKRKDFDYSVRFEKANLPE